jgi:2,3-bisphosphoglycerate-dependent phosphoglycerate mutase
MRQSARIGLLAALTAAVSLSGVFGVQAADDPKSCVGDNQNVAPTTIIICRHAEKEEGAGNVPLSAPGRDRAYALAKVCGSSGLVALYGATREGDDRRVRETLKPVADLLGLGPKIMMIANPFDMEILAHDIRTNFSGKTVLIVSHSTTVEEIIRTFHGDDSRCPIGGDFDNLCVVTICAPGNVNVLRLRY